MMNSNNLLTDKSKPYISKDPSLLNKDTNIINYNEVKNENNEKLKLKDKNGENSKKTHNIKKKTKNISNIKEDEDPNTIQSEFVNLFDDNAKITINAVAKCIIFLPFRLDEITLAR